jgi:hypothetical protein
MTRFMGQQDFSLAKKIMEECDANNDGALEYDEVENKVFAGYEGERPVMPVASPSREGPTMSPIMTCGKASPSLGGNRRRLLSALVATAHEISVHFPSEMEPGQLDDKFEEAIDARALEPQPEPE